MNRARQFRLLTIGLLLALVWLPGEARAAQCGSTAAGFEAWKRQFAGEAQARGVSASTIAALMATNYSTVTCSRCPDAADGLRGPARLTARSACLAAFYLAWPSDVERGPTIRGGSMNFETTPQGTMSEREPSGFADCRGGRRRLRAVSLGGRRCGRGPYTSTALTSLAPLWICSAPLPPRPSRRPTPASSLGPQRLREIQRYW
jgi:hypothetical protein